MVRILHQITNIIEPLMNEGLETLAGIYAAAVKVYLNDIVHALTMIIIRRLQAKLGTACITMLYILVMLTLQSGAVWLLYSMSLPAAF